MPKSLFAKNRDELLRFTNLRPEQIVIVDGPKARDRLNDTAAVVFIMGADRFKLCHEELGSSVRNLVADELHLYWSTHKSQRTQAWYRAMRRFPRFVGMTGTLIAGRLDSAYPTIHVIEPRYYAGYQDFLNRHALMDDYGTVIGWKNVDHIAQIIGRHSIRRSFADVYGPEAKVIVTETCPMSPKQREAYEEFESKALLELENEFLEAPTGGTFALRCRQIMAHPETWDLSKGEPTGKDDLLAIHLANHHNNREPLVIYAAFVPEQERILRLVRSHGMTADILNGGTSGPKRAEIDKRFRDGQIQVLVGSPAVASVGFNWSHVNHIIFTSLDYQDSSFIQAYRRAIRGQRTTPLLISVLEYEKSLDQRVFAIIERKSRLASAVNPDKEAIKLSA